MTKTYWRKTETFKKCSVDYKINLPVPKTKLEDGTRYYKGRSKHKRVVKWLCEILAEDVMSTSEILNELHKKTYVYNGNKVNIKHIPSQQKLLNILRIYPEFIRVNAKTERPALWGLR
mgnify:CR=1 FL=1